MSKVTLEGYILVPESDLSAVESALGSHTALTRQEAGCLVFDVSQDETNKNRFNVYEEFVDRSAFESHQERVRQSEWGKVAAGAERHYRITEE